MPAGPAPLVSAIVAAYNYAGYLPRTLDSALAQDYPAESLEIVVVDDGSTDDTPSVLADYERRHPGRVRAIRQENGGYVNATNTALRAARGQYLAILDADDLWPPEKVAKQVAIMEERPEVGLVYGDLTVIDAHDRVLRPSHWEHDGVTPARGPGLLGRLVRGNFVGASTIMVRAALRDAFFPIPDGIPYVDWWLATSVSAVAELDYFREPRIGYRLHDHNLTHGATGHRAAREHIKAAIFRRHVLRGPLAELLTPRELGVAFLAFENEALHAVNAARSPFLVPMPVVTDADRAAAAEAARAAREATDPVQALRHWVHAAMCDPFDGDVREAARELAQAAQHVPDAPPDPLTGARRFVTLARAEELVATPELLAAYAQCFSAADDATLLVHAPGWSAEEAGGRLAGPVAATGLSGERAADVLVLAVPAD